MKIERFLLHYHPPMIVVEYVSRVGEKKFRAIELMDLSPPLDRPDKIVTEICLKENKILSEKRHFQILLRLIYKLQERISVKVSAIRYENFRSVSVHVLPLTNVVINKDGTRYATSSYDGTCIIVDTYSGEVEFVLGPNSSPSDSYHKSVVYAMAYDYPYCRRIVTGSFDKTAIIWDAKSGESIHHLQGHCGEIVCVNFSHDGRLVVTGSMDTTAIVWDVKTGSIISSLSGHSGEIVSAQFARTNPVVVLTGSFDTTCRIWNALTGECMHILSGHSGEISCAKFRFRGDILASGSIDGTCILWDVESGKVLWTLSGHVDEILDIAFDSIGKRIATASSDGTCRVYDVSSGKLIYCLGSCESRHDAMMRDEINIGEIVKVNFSADGTLIVTASTDHTCRIYSSSTGELVQTMFHEEIFYADFSYNADLLFTVSKDNSCRVWRRS
jgi:dynein assembly factor with WDR repeat domains 1